MLRPPHIKDHLDGPKWKAETLEALYPEVVGIVDDNPSLVNHLPDNYPGVVFLFNNTESPRRDLNIIPCPTWHDVHDAVRAYSTSTLT